MRRQREVANLYRRSTWPPHLDRRVADGLAYNAFTDEDLGPHGLHAVEGLPLTDDTLDQTALSSDMIGSIDGFLQVCLRRQQVRAQGPSPGRSAGKANAPGGIGAMFEENGRQRIGCQLLMQAQQARRTRFAANGNAGYAYAAKDAVGMPELPAGEQPRTRYDRHAEPYQEVFDTAGRPSTSPPRVWEVLPGRELSAWRQWND